jgi:hypothetical protein
MPSARPLLPTAGLLLGMAVTLGGCADYFVVERPTQGPTLEGAISRAQASPGWTCDEMKVDVSVGYNPVTTRYPGGGQTPVGRLAGRAYLSGSAGDPLSDAILGMQGWYLEGDLYENGVALVTLTQATILPSGPTDSVGAKPFSVFRGTLIDNRLEMAELLPSCGRQLVAQVGGMPEPLTASR